MDSPQHSLPSRLAFGVLVLLGYVAIANTVQQLYPFSVFDMYAHQATSASRIAVRDAAGAVSEVSAWTDWRCDGPIALATAPDHADRSPYSIPYRDREAQEWLTGHVGNGAQAVEVVRHIWWLQPEAGQAEIEDRVLLHCKARRP